MEIGEKQLPFPDQFVFRFNGFLHLHNHFGMSIYILYRRQDTGTDGLVVAVAEAATFSGGVLYEDLMSMSDKLGYASGCHTYSVLIVFDFLWYSDSHSRKVLKRLLSAAKIRKIPLRCSS